LVEIKSQHSSDTSVEIHIIYPPTSSERFKETSPHQNSSLQYTIKNQVNVISKSTSSGSMSSRIIEHIHTHTNTIKTLNEKCRVNHRCTEQSQIYASDVSTVQSWSLLPLQSATWIADLLFHGTEHAHERPHGK
ncbi:hypothetical protein PV326_005328, partial [Microctonus aethiopoides]